MIDWVQQVVLFSTVRFFSSFIFRHTRKRTGGVGFGFGLGWVVGSSHFFLFFLERMYGSLRFRVV